MVRHFAVGIEGGHHHTTLVGQASSQVGDSVNTLSAGVDTVTIVDDRGCTAFIDTVVINEPAPLLVTTTNLVPAYCVGVNYCICYCIG